MKKRVTPGTLLLDSNGPKFVLVIWNVPDESYSSMIQIGCLDEKKFRFIAVANSVEVEDFNVIEYVP
jgi:hypothetical protein